MTDYKQLCADLLRELDHASAWDYQQALKDQARAALAESEPEGATPSDEELLRHWDLVPGARAYEDDVVDLARAVLSRYGRPAPAPAGEVGELVDELRVMASQAAEACQFSDAESLSSAADLLDRQAAPVPVPVSERLPGPEECLDEGWAWFFNPRTGWRQATQPVHSTYTHWLPADALPLPTTEPQP